MKKNYNKAVIDTIDVSSTTMIALELSTGQNGVLDFKDNPGDTTGWSDLFN